MGLSEHAKEQIRRLAQQLETPQAAIVPALHIVHEQEGWLTEQAAEEVAAILGQRPADITGVASFYSLFSLKPQGQFVIRVCRSISCTLMGVETILDHLKRRLGIEIGETTEDGMFTLQTCECIGACDRGPAMRVNEQYHERLTPERVDEVLKELEARSLPNRG